RVRGPCGNRGCDHDVGELTHFSRGWNELRSERPLLADGPEPTRTGLPRRGGIPLATSREAPCPDGHRGERAGRTGTAAVFSRPTAILRENSTRRACCAQCRFGAPALPSRRC